jgi:flagellar basal body-associated protein FliL
LKKQPEANTKKKIIDGSSELLAAKNKKAPIPAAQAAGEAGAVSEQPAAADPRLSEEEKRALPGPDEPPAEAGQAPGTRRTGFRKLLLIALPVLAVVGIGFGAFLYLSAGPADAPPEERPVTFLEKPISMAADRESLTFFVFPANQAKKNLVVLRIAFEFRNPANHQGFKKQNALFRDTVGGFLQKQQPQRHSMKYWQPLVETGLLEYLKGALPQSQADIIRVSKVETL